MVSLGLVYSGQLSQFGFHQCSLWKHFTVIFRSIQAVRISRAYTDFSSLCDISVLTKNGLRFVLFGKTNPFDARPTAETTNWPDTLPFLEGLQLPTTTLSRAAER
jgi:hypothetical protein